MPDLASFDYIILLVLLLFLFRGLCAGFIRQLAVSFALVGSYWLAGRYVSEVIPYAEQMIDQPKTVFLASFLGLFLLFVLMVILLGKLLHKMMEAGETGWFNRILGGILGLIRGALVMVLVYMFLSSILPPSHHIFRNSQTVPYMIQGGEILRQFIEDSRVREDLKPLKEAPVKAKESEEQAVPIPPITTAPAPDTSAPQEQEAAPEQLQEPEGGQEQQTSEDSGQNREVQQQPLNPVD